MAKPLSYNSTLVRRDDLESTLAVFTIRPDRTTPREADTPQFVPGQYVTIGLNRENPEDPEDPRPISVRRAMSIASPPEADDIYELYIRYVGEPESSLPLTHLLWPAQPGDRLFCRAKAVGKFTLRDTVGEDDPRLKVMVAAGTGLAPFICMARSRLRRDPNARLDDFAILHAASYSSSLGYREELEELAQGHGLRYVPTISRPQAEPTWTGCTGRVETLLDRGRRAETEERLGLGPGELTPDHVAVFICGLQGTIANTIINLLPSGFIPDNRRIRRALAIAEDWAPSIFWEQYDTAPVIDLKDAELMSHLRGVVSEAAAVG